MPDNIEFLDFFCRKLGLDDKAKTALTGTQDKDLLAIFGAVTHLYMPQLELNFFARKPSSLSEAMGWQLGPNQETLGQLLSAGKVQETIAAIEFKMGGPITLPERGTQTPTSPNTTNLAP